MSSVEYQPSTMALASILVARGGRERTAPNLDEELKAILGSSWQQLHTVSPHHNKPSLFGNLLVKRAMMSKCSPPWRRGMCIPATA